MDSIVCIRKAGEIKTWHIWQHDLIRFNLQHYFVCGMFRTTVKTWNVELINKTNPFSEKTWIGMSVGEYKLTSSE